MVVAMVKTFYQTKSPNQCLRKTLKMATVQIRRPKNVWGNNLTLNYDISVSVNNFFFHKFYIFIYNIS